MRELPKGKPNSSYRCQSYANNLKKVLDNSKSFCYNKYCYTWEGWTVRRFQWRHQERAEEEKCVKFPLPLSTFIFIGTKIEKISVCEKIFLGSQSCRVILVWISEGWTYLLGSLIFCSSESKQDFYADPIRAWLLWCLYLGLHRREYHLWKLWCADNLPTFRPDLKGSEAAGNEVCWLYRYILLSASHLGHQWPRAGMWLL